MAEVPKIIKDFRVWINGNDTGFNVEEMVLPKITEKLETIQMGIMETEVFMGVEKMETELTLLGHDPKLNATIGVGNLTGNLIILKAAQDDNLNNVDKITIIMRGRFTERDFGSLKRGEKGSIKFKASLKSYAYLINDIPYDAVDPETNTYIIGGVNQLEKINKALGV